MVHVRAGMQRTIVFGEGQVAHSRLPKADHGHMWRWYIFPLMGLQALPLLTLIHAGAPHGFNHHKPERQAIYVCHQAHCRAQQQHKLRTTCSGLPEPAEEIEGVGR